MPLAIGQAEKIKFFRTSQKFDFPSGTILGSAKDPCRFKERPSSLCPIGTLRSRRGSAELLRLTFPCASFASTCCWPGSIFPTPFGLWADPCTASYGGSSFSRRDAWRLRYSGANSLSTVCLHAAGSHPPAAAQEAKAQASRGTQKREGKPRNTPKNHKFRKFSELLEGPCKCLQTNYSNYLGTSQKVGLAILSAKQ